MIKRNQLREPSAEESKMGFAHLRYNNINTLIKENR